MWLASLGFIINWLGDSLDGTVARYRNIERPKYGFFVDHTVDALDEMLVFLGLGLSPMWIFPGDTDAAGLHADDRFSLHHDYRQWCFSDCLHLVGSTEMRVIAILCNTIIYFIRNPSVKLPIIGVVGLYNIFVGCIAALLFGGYIVIMFLKAAELSRIDEKKKP